ncbi:MAG: 4-hydroxybenzoate octaprenyltransferase [Pseudomonadota bacterium]|jgi:4-hydroxybenzoate polyprenyltransferase
MKIAYYTIDYMNTLPRWRAYLALLRLHQPIGIFLLLWPALWALWIANAGIVDIKMLILFSIGALLTRSLGCVINDIADRNLDGLVARTRFRPLATGAVSLSEAMILLIVLSVLAGLVVYQLNRLTIELAFIAVGMIVIYPFTKRYIAWPQLFLGIVFGAWSILMAFTAETGKIPGIAWLLFLAAYGWCVAYDTIYAMVDREDDKRVGIKSSAIALGRHEVQFIAALECVFVLLLVIIGRCLNLHPIYYAILILVVGLFIYQHYLIKDRKPAACFQAFLNNAWIGGLVFLGFFLGMPR